MQVLSRPENEILFQMSLLKNSLKLFGLALILLGQLLPPFIYGLFLILMAVKNNLAFLTPGVIAALFSLLSIGIIIFNYGLVNLGKEKEISRIKRALDKQWVRSFPQICVEWLIRREFFKFFSTKISAAIILYAGAKLYFTDEYDWRLMALAVTVSFSCSVMIIAEFHHIENNLLMWTRNISLSRLTRFSNALVVLIILILPEIVILIKYYPPMLSSIVLINLIGYGISTQCFFYSLLFNKRFADRNFTQALFAFVILWLLLVLSGVPLLIITIINIAIAIIVYGKSFYNYQPID
jgi:hypothetical protein